MARKRAPKHEDQAEQLVIEHMDLVPPIARRLHRSLPHELDDLIQAGRMGLLEAARRHDGSAPFSAFARIRIRGAILDFARMSRTYGPIHPDEKGPRPVQAKMPANLAAPESVARLEEALDAAKVIALGLAALSDSEYRMVQMTYRQGLDIPESSEKLGVSQEEAYVIRKRAVRKLRKQVMKRGGKKAA